MNQALHIFKKDVRHFWPEILLSLLVLSIYVCVQPFLWTGHIDFRAQEMRDVSAILAMLIPVSWWVLSARSILDERLVGDTQFWITRPYAWMSLLAAKAMFVAAFLAVPFFIAESTLLAMAGFAPHSFLPGLLFDLGLMLVTVVLPLTAIATVTSSFAKMTLTLLGILLALAFAAAVSSMYAAVSTSVNTADTGGSNAVAWTTWAACLLAVILTQYARRRVWLARGILLAVPLLFWGISFVSARYNQSRFDSSYPAAQNGAPVQLAYHPIPGSHGTTGMQASSTAMIPISFELDETGVAQGRILIQDAVRAVLTAPDGSQWDSGWQTAGGEYKLSPGTSNFSPQVRVPLATAEKYQSTHVNVQLSVAFTEARADQVAAAAISSDAFSVSGFGACYPQTGWAPEFGHITGISCIAPVTAPQLTYVSTYWSDGPCTGGPTTPDQGVVGSGWAGTLNRGHGDFGFSPVQQVNVPLSNNQDNNKSRYLCPGTPITFTRYLPVGRAQVSVDVKDLPLPKVSVIGNQLTVTQ